MNIQVLMVLKLLIFSPNTFLNSVYINSKSKYSTFNPSNSLSTSSTSLNFPLSSGYISQSDIFIFLNSINTRLSAGPDLIPNIFIQHCKFVFAPLLY